MRRRPALLSFHLWCFSDSAQVSGDGYLGSMETYGSCGMDQHKNKLHGFLRLTFFDLNSEKKRLGPEVGLQSCHQHQNMTEIVLFINHLIWGHSPLFFFETLNMFGGNLRQHSPTNQRQKGRFFQHEATTPPRNPMGFAYPRNIHMVNATTAKLSSMHFHGWERGSMAEVR